MMDDRRFAGLAVLLTIIFHFCGCHEQPQHQEQVNNPSSKLAAAFENKPEQIHMSLGSHPNDIIIMWSTQMDDKAYVEYGEDPSSLTRVLAKKTELKEHSAQAKKFLHRAELLDLKYGGHYSYRIVIGDHGAKSLTYTFDVPHNDIKKQHKFMVLADMGLKTKALKFVVHEVINGEYEAVFHIGDFAYNLDMEGGSRGDTYMNLIQDFTARVPYMTTPGDHEHMGNALYHYRNRFSMPNSPWPMSDQSLWYSIDIGYTHFISINTEVLETPTHLNTMQLGWLREDLTAANKNRKAHPWIIVLGHKPMYCTKSVMEQSCHQDHSTLRAQLEDMFYEHGVDLYVSGHKHCYERSWPMYLGKVFQTNTINPKAPIYIINGAMGYEYLVDEQKSNPYWLAFGDSDRQRELFARLFVMNETHLEWSVHAASNNEEIDNMLIIQKEHGSFGIVGPPAFEKINTNNAANNLPPEPFHYVSQVSEPYYNPSSKVVFYASVLMLSLIILLFIRNPRIRKSLRLWF